MNALLTSGTPSFVNTNFSAYAFYLRPPIATIFFSLTSKILLAFVPTIESISLMQKKRTRKKKAVAKTPRLCANAQRGTQPRVKPSLRIDTSTDIQLKEWGNDPCSKGVGDVVDRVVIFAKKKKFNPCAAFKIDATSV